MLPIGIFLIELIFLFWLSRLVTRSLSQLLFRLTDNAQTTVQILSLVFLPGIAIHELAHLLVASLLFVPVGEIEFLPKLTEQGVKLGSVEVAKTDPLRRALIGLAPIVVGVVLILLILFYVSTTALPIELPLPVQFTMVGYTVFVIANTMFASSKDLEGIIEFIIALAIVLGLILLTDLRQYLPSMTIVFPEQFLDLVRKANMFLLVPLGIDVLMLVAARALGRGIRR